MPYEPRIKPLPLYTPPASRWEALHKAATGHHCAECPAAATLAIEHSNGTRRYYCHDHVDYAEELIDPLVNVSGRHLLRVLVEVQ